MSHVDIYCICEAGGVSVAHITGFDIVDNKKNQVVDSVEDVGRTPIDLAKSIM